MQEEYTTEQHRRAAAEELYEACKSARYELEFPDMDEAARLRLIAKLDAAIAKAEGRS